MKRTALLISACFLLTACGKWDDPDVTVNTFKASINGNGWTASETTWSNLNYLLQIEGKNGNTRINFSIPNYTGARTYELSAFYRGAVYVENNTEYIVKNGTINIITDDQHHLKGIFSFTASDNSQARKIEHGAFVLNK